VALVLVMTFVAGLAAAHYAPRQSVLSGIRVD
jgi:hypothetical protein